MSNIAIRVENLGKQYRLGEIGTGTLSHDLNRWWARMRGKEDPFAKIGEANDRTTKGNSEYVWALKDVNFDVKAGEVLGIIGRNGAGKSTLLKILSKVTAPTTGRIKVNGRIASLLEVGTGFHPELTGRENIYLNGAILGMSKSEINRKFDEIVDFSGVERYIDTPVKRYSSGMYVRLAFAVSAFLEPEILIVDEVLAVGDAEFQKKCLGRMKDVSTNDGRTILFVSHNMAAVSTLCSTSVLMQHGTVLDHGDTKNIIEQYISIGRTSNGEVWEDDIKCTLTNPNLKFKKVSLMGKNGPSNSFGLDEDIVCQIDYEVVSDSTTVVPSIHLLNNYGECILASFNATSVSLIPDPYFDKVLPKGQYRVQCTIPRYFLNDTQYTISAFIANDISFHNMTSAEEVISFEVNETGAMRQEHIGTWIGQIRPRLEWKTTKEL
ncbi:ABC transporter ATP-binding protein [Hymenobacter arizonensis]|uniref:Lipopolysaccharide transport system ATP-binding protein n=1 Tax=Hymenobacter arizonensis TaxID=1227077 RepID=A0A1I6A0E0_HYMAR|nr:polysaccharide ABC transporter ATP-binding protein [Hymenobacter arizonensis]SFQ62224.1 lipopolysaccharide transport system ATP-binding protein [Hymenobacter arizonensis]